MITELKDSIVLSAWPAVVQLREGLKNLGVLDILKDNQDLLQQFFCFQPPVLSPGKCNNTKHTCAYTSYVNYVPFIIEKHCSNQYWATISHFSVASDLASA